MEYASKREKNTVTVTFTATEEEFIEAERIAFQKERGRYAVPGFRKGKAPKHMIEQAYGPVFFESALDELIQNKYEDYLNGLTNDYPLDKPQLNIKNYDTKSLEWEISFTVNPIVELCDYKNITIKKIEHTVSDEDVDNELKRIQERNAKFDEVETAENGDTVNLDYSGSIGGEKFDGGSATGQNLVLGSNTFIPGFEDQLVGCKAGEEKAISVKFPDDYHADELKGKDAIFECKINKITRKTLPEIDDSLAQDVSDFETLEEYKKQIKTDLEESAKQKTKSEKEDAIIEAIVAGSKADIPDCLIDQTEDELVDEFANRLSAQKLSIDDFFKYTGTTREKYKEDSKDAAISRIMKRLCMRQIVENEKIEATDEEAKAKYKEEMEKYSLGNDLKELSAAELDMFKESVIIDKMFDLLLSTVKEEESSEKKVKKSKKD
ncbi:MAG: trigger factor [Clostridia bacterium]|nr:trigger factor [Clostridia bacterium]